MDEKITWGVIGLLVMKEIVSVLGKLFQKGGQSVIDHETRIAVAYEKLQALSDKIAIIDRDQKTQWREFDKIRGYLPKEKRHDNS